MKVGDLVKFYNPEWKSSGQPTPDYGLGLIEEEIVLARRTPSDGQKALKEFRVYWPNLKKSCRMGPKVLKVVNEAR